MAGVLKKILDGKKLMTLVSLLGLYLISTGSSLAIFSYLREEPNVNPGITKDPRYKVDPSLPKTEECPVNGKMFSKPEKDIWEDRRPATVVIENHNDSRPQSGLSFADVVYEAVAEGGITRFLAVFYCGASVMDVKVAPIRSVRVYFIDWASEYGKKPIFVHIGGANNICNNCPGGVKPFGQVAREVDAFKMLQTLGWRLPKGNDFDGGTNVGYPIIVRDQYRLGEKAAWEHSVVGSTDKIFEEAKTRGFGFKNETGKAWIDDFQEWRFTDDKPVSTTIGEITFEFWPNKGDYDVTWKYDKENNTYKRVNGGKDHIDHETKEQLFAKNVVIQFVKEKGPVDNEGHMVYTTTGQGKALVFQNGDVVEATWKKISQASRTKFYEKDGKEVAFVRGPIWIEEVPAGNEIKY